MKAKILVAVFMLLLMAQAFAAVTVTISKPANGTVINNLWQQTLDINFSGTDNNTGVERTWRYFDINYYSNATSPSSGIVILADANMALWEDSPTSGKTCVIDGNGASFTCSYSWDLPNNDTMGDAGYFININVYDLNGSETEVGNHVTADKNATNSFVVFTGLAGAQSVRDIMALVGVVLAGMVIITAVLSVAFLKSDPMNTAIIAVVASVTVAIAAQIIGIVLSTL